MLFRAAVGIGVLSRFRSLTSVWLLRVALLLSSDAVLKVRLVTAVAVVVEVVCA